MTNQEQEKLNEAMKAQAIHQQGAAISGNLSSGWAYEPSIRDRVAMKLDRAQQEAKKAERLQELANLMAQYPDIARMFELMTAHA